MGVLKRLGKGAAKMIEAKRISVPEAPPAIQKLAINKNPNLSAIALMTWISPMTGKALFHFVIKDAVFGELITAAPPCYRVTDCANPCEDTLSDLCEEYAAWNKEQGLTLGSADEHLFDESLTPSQRMWIRDFCRRWEEAS